MDAGLIALRMRLSGGKQVATEAGVADAAITKTAATAEAAGKKASTGIRRSLTSQIQTMRSIGRGLTRYVTAPILGVAAISGKFAYDFDRNMRNVNSIAQLPERQFKRLKQSVLDLAGPTAQTPNTLAEGLYDLVSSGFNAKEAIHILGKAALAASAGLTTTEVSTKAVAAALNAYHLPASRAGAVSDTLFETVNRGVLTFDQLASTIGDALPFAAQLGVNLNEVGAAVSTMTKQGISSAEAITRIKNVFVAFLKPSKDLQEVLKRMGMTGEELLQKRGFQGAMEALRTHTDGTNEAVAALFPNIRGMGGVLALTGKSAKSAGEDLAAFQNTAGATAKVLKEQEKSFGFQMQRAWADLQAVLIEIGEQVLPIVIPPFLSLLGLVRDTVHGFAMLPDPVKAAAGELAVLAALAGPMLLFASAVLTAAKNLGILQATQAGTTLNKGRIGRLAAGAAGIGAITAGSAVGGTAGSLISNVGGGAGLGFAVGGPLGAAVGGTAGAVLTALPAWKALLGLQRELSPVQARLAASEAELTHWSRQQGIAAKGLVAADQRLNGAQRRRSVTARRLQAAHRDLTAVVQEYGLRSQPALRAETRLTAAADAHRRALKRLENAEKLRGTALSAYKTVTNQTVLAERHRINVLSDLASKQGRQYREALAANPTSQRTITLAQNYQSTLGKLSDTTSRHGKTLQDAARRGGAKYANFLRTASQETLRFGGTFKVLDAKVRALTENLRRLSETPVAPTPPTPFDPPSPLPGRSGDKQPRATARPRRNTRSEATAGSSALKHLMSQGGRPRTVHHQPVQLVLAPGGRRILAETVVEVQEDEDASR